MSRRRCGTRMRLRSEKPKLAWTRLAQIRPGTDSAGYEASAFHIAAGGPVDARGRRLCPGLADAPCRAAACRTAGGKKGSAEAKGSCRGEAAHRDADADAQARDHDQARRNADALPLADVSL